MRIFVLSPARTDGVRASLLLRPEADFPLARTLRSAEGAALGDLFSFSSALYFRGKLTYARAFARPPRDSPGVWVITSGRGLLTPETRLTREGLRELGSVPVDEAVEAYTKPLRRDIARLATTLPSGAQVVLLGSVASSKYTPFLLEGFGPRLLFPGDFVGRGDMSRGGLLLRSARSGEELSYAPIQDAVLRGSRPAKLPRLSGVRRT